MGVRDIYGLCFDGYCDEVAPSALPHFYHAAGSVTFSHLPSYPEYQMVFDQGSERTAGNVNVSYSPIAQELLIRLSWPRMPKADRDALETFFNTVAKGAAVDFTYSNNGTGPALPVRFADPVLPVMPEVGYQQYRVGLVLRVTANFPQIQATGAAAALPGNRFVVDGAAVSIPVAVKGESGRGVAKVQTIGRDSSGSAVIYDKATLALIPHALQLFHDYDGWVSLQGFFFTFANGARKRFTWVDQGGTSRTVRLASPSIVSRQLGVNRFETMLNLVEEVAA